MMTARPALTTTTSIRDAAMIMTARHLRHLPVAGNAGLPAPDRQHQRVPGIDQRQRRITKAPLQIRSGRPSPAAMRQTSAKPHNAWFGAAHSGWDEINSTAQAVTCAVQLPSSLCC